MGISDIFADLEASMARRSASLPERIRPFTRARSDLPRAISLTGPRGVGKTTFLLFHAQGRRMLYFSADNPLIAGERLYDVVKAAFMAGYSGVIVDEVHFMKDWSLHLKALYDDFPQHSIWISDSSSLVLRTGTGDLSRRYVPLDMPLLSFREFLYLETGVEYPVWDPFRREGGVPAAATSEVLEAFRRYRAAGTRPFYGEGDFPERMLAVLDKTLYFDIPFFIPNVNDGNLRLMKAVTATLAASPIPRLKVNSLCADWGVGSDKLYQLLEVMDSVGILRIIRLENDRKAKTAGEKLFFADPAFYPILHGDTGTAREAMVAMLCTAGGWLVEAAKDETAGDFVITRHEGGARRRLFLEVGGAGKSRKKADFVIRDDTDLPGTDSIPLWLLGMLY